MNVQQVIEALSKFPSNTPVRVVTSDVYFADELGEQNILLSVEDATEADEVSNQGGFVLIQGK